MKVELLKTDGTRETHEVEKGPRLFEQLYKLAGCDTFDTVNLRDGRVMMVDDNGYETETIDHGNGRITLKPIRARKPVNVEATKLYHARCVPGTTHQIVGDCIIANDADFGDDS